MNKNVAHTALFFAGFAAGTAYVASCGQDSASAANGMTAAGVEYANTQSGLNATTVQAAIDEIGTTLQAAIIPSAHRGALTVGPSWTGEVIQWDGSSDTMVTSTGFTVIFTETSDGEGTYQTSPSNILMKDSGPAPSGPTTGKYWIVGNHLTVSTQISAAPSPAYTAFSWEIGLTDAGRTMTFADGSFHVRLIRGD